MLTAGQSSDRRTATAAPSTDFRATWEARMREEEARSEFGRTVADVLRFLKRAKEIQVAVRVTTDRASSPECVFLSFSKSAFREALKYRDQNEPMPCAFDPAEAHLSVGSLRAINHAKENGAAS